jgi:hypothetical protein
VAAMAICSVCKAGSGVRREMAKEGRRRSRELGLGSYIPFPGPSLLSSIFHVCPRGRSKPPAS